MNPKRTGITIFLILITVIGAGSLLYTMLRLRQHPEFIGDDADRIRQIEKAKGETITLTETQDGHRKWVLKMKELKYSKDNSRGQLKGVQGLVYDDNQKVLFIFNAPSGTYYKDTNRVILMQGSMTAPLAKVTITAPRLDWSAQGKMIEASGGVRMIKQDVGVTQAESAKFAMDFSKIQFTGNATSVLGGSSKHGSQRPE